VTSSTHERSESLLTACPACTSAAVHVGPPSRRTGIVVARCRDCRAQFLVEDSQAPSEVVDTDEVSVEYVSDWVEKKREGVGPQVWHEKLTRISESVAGLGRTPKLYDVGAGAGEFLATARDEYGFAVAGNDILEGAVAVAKELSDVDLDLGDLSQVQRDDEYDAITMLCVLAHVRNGEQMMLDVHRMLAPGGVLFLQTPHNSAPDRAIYRTKVATGGRVSRFSDRRLAGHHRILHTTDSITKLLTRVGFTDVEVEPQIRYPMSSLAYLHSLRAPEWSLRPASWAMDKVVASKAAPRITLDVWARKR
jgi:2-polyprenyl-3-methyl-5-hydroxy-6-metoxy-1,4-benzoquinol methylase